MFRKREKKVFPPGTFIPTPARIAAILHLCLAFSLLLWIMSQPFMGDLFAVKSELVLYDAVLAQEELVRQLPLEEAQWLREQYEALKAQLQIPFFDKLKMMWNLLLVKTPPLELAWLFFSILISLLLLLRYEGAAQACWLLPIIVFAYSWDNQWNASKAPKALDYALFPSEEMIIRDYLDTPLSPKISEQKEALTRGWKRYLIENWARETPSNDLHITSKQLEKGEFAFTMARIKARAQNKILAIDAVPYRQSLWILALYLFWNCFFASVAMRFLISRHLLTNCAAIGAPSLPNPPKRK
jgi:hypothetical protein